MQETLLIIVTGTVSLTLVVCALALRSANQRLRGIASTAEITRANLDICSSDLTRVRMNLAEAREDLEAWKAATKEVSDREADKRLAAIELCEEIDVYFNMGKAGPKARKTQQDKVKEVVNKIVWLTTPSTPTPPAEEQA